MNNDKKPAVNEAARLVGALLRIKHPRPVEPEEYSSQAEALIALRRVSGLTPEQLAMRLGVTVAMYDKAESGMAGGNLQVPQLDLAIDFASRCCLPVMVKFLGFLLTTVREQGKSHGPKRHGSNWWKQEEETRGRDKYVQRGGPPD